MILDDGLRLDQPYEGLIGKRILALSFTTLRSVSVRGKVEAERSHAAYRALNRSSQLPSLAFREA